MEGLVGCGCRGGRAGGDDHLRRQSPGRAGGRGLADGAAGSDFHAFGTRGDGWRRADQHRHRGGCAADLDTAADADAHANCAPEHHADHDRADADPVNADSDRRRSYADPEAHGALMASASARPGAAGVSGPTSGRGFAAFGGGLLDLEQQIGQVERFLNDPVGAAGV